MDGFLDNMRARGDFDSEGHFTISKEKSTWKLAQYRLANPGKFPLFALASAVEGGARNFKLRVGSGQTRLEFDGKPFSHEEFVALRGSSLEAGQSKRLHNINIAVSAAAGFGNFKFVSVEGTKEHFFTSIDGEVVYAQRPRDGSTKGNVMVVETQIADSDIVDFLECSRYAPIHTVVESSVAQPKAQEFGKTAKCWASQRGVDLFDFPLTSVAKLPKVRLTKELKSVSSYFLVLDPSTRQGEFILLQSGVEVERFKLPSLNSHFVSGILSLPNFKKDISQTAFLRDVAFSELMEELKAITCHFTLDFLRSNPALGTLTAFKLTGFLLSKFESPELRQEIESIRRRFEKKAALGTVQATKSFSKLSKLAKEARESQDWSVYNTMMSRLRDAMEPDWDEGNWLKAKAWARAIRFLAQEGEQDGIPFQSTEESLNFLSDLTPDMAWLRSLADSKDIEPQIRLRALFVVGSELWPQDLVQRAKQLEVPELWTLPLRFLGTEDLSTLSCRQALLWEVARRICNQGPFTDIVELTKTGLESAVCSRDARAVWMQVLSFATRGKLSWSEQVNLRMELSRCWLKLDFNARNRFRNFIGRRRRPDPPTPGLSWFETELPEGDLMFPYLVYQMFLLSEDTHKVRFEIFGRRLLKESFNGVGEPGNFEERLPLSLFEI